MIAEIHSSRSRFYIEGDGKMLCRPGWTDLFSHFADPGFEHKETLHTGAASAVAGGYTQVYVLPNTNPPVYNKTGVEYIVQKSKDAAG